jgi:hypothetical protein
MLILLRHALIDAAGTVVASITGNALAEPVRG